MTDLADYYALSRGERDLLTAVAQYNDANQTPTGASVGDRVQELRGGDERPANKTVYDGLARLERLGFVSCEAENPRKNVYRVTDDGHAVIQAVVDELPATH